MPLDKAAACTAHARQPHRRGGVHARTCAAVSGGHAARLSRRHDKTLARHGTARQGQHSTAQQGRARLPGPHRWQKRSSCPSRRKTSALMCTAQILHPARQRGWGECQHQRTCRAGAPSGRSEPALRAARDRLRAGSTRGRRARMLPGQRALGSAAHTLCTQPHLFRWW